MCSIWIRKLIQVPNWLRLGVTSAKLSLASPIEERQTTKQTKSSSKENHNFSKFSLNIY